MPAADLVIFGTLLTVDELQPTAEALAVSDGRIIAVGDRSAVESWIGPRAQVLTVDGCVLPGFVDAAWQLFADDVIGSLEVGKYADMVVLSADPREVSPEQIAGLEVRSTFLAGHQVYLKSR